jgi:hypothetical protein
MACEPSLLMPYGLPPGGPPGLPGRGDHNIFRIYGWWVSDWLQGPEQIVTYMWHIYITIFIIHDCICIYNYIYILPNPIVVVLMFFISFYTSSDILVDHRFHGNFCRTWYCGLGRCSAVDAVNWGKIRRFSFVPGEPFHVWCWNPLAECPRFSLCYPALLVKGRVSQMFASCTSTDRSCCFLFLVHLEIGKIVESSISVIAPTLLGLFQKWKLSTQDGKTWNAGMPHKFLPCIPYQAPFHVWINKLDP